MFAEKLVLSYPVWKGTIEAGEEFVSSRFSSDYMTDAEIIDDANTRVDEKILPDSLISDRHSVVSVLEPD